MNTRDEKANSALELILRKSRIKQIANEEANKRYESDEVKNILWKQV